VAAPMHQHRCNTDTVKHRYRCRQDLPYHSGTLAVGAGRTSRSTAVD
jgi:hypothetical protein